MGEEEEDSTEMALNIFNSPDPFEFSLLPYAPQRDNHGGTDLENRCLMMQNASPTSEACVEAGLMPTMQSNVELAESSQFVSQLPRERIRRVLDFETPRNRQIMSDNNMDSCRSSSRCGVQPCIFHHLNAIPMPSKGCKTNVICEDLSAGTILGSRSTMYSQEICKQETLEIEPWGDVVRELDDGPAETVRVMPTLQSDAESTEFLRRMGLLDFEIPRNMQIMSDNNYMASCQSSSRCGVLPSIFHHLNAIVMPSKDCKPNVIYEDLSAGKIPSSSSTMYSRDICKQETLEIEPRGDVVRELGDVPAETAGVMPTLQSNTEFAESLRMRLLDFETPWNRQIMSDNNTASRQSPSRYGVPYIGLDLNAIPMSSKDCKTNLIHEDSSARNLPGSTSRSRPEEMRPMFAAGETKSYKGCNCKKSNCMRLYCECFAGGAYCLETCWCINCFNKPVHEDVIIAARKKIESRNQLAFAPKVIRSSESVPETWDDANKTKTQASARHKRGCNCMKSKCLKKYCECYQGGVGCSINCKCEGCKNRFGRRDERFFHSL